MRTRPVKSWCEMFFLVMLTWATLGTEPPRVIKPYKTLDECLAAASKQNLSTSFGPPPWKFVCAEVRGET